MYTTRQVRSTGVQYSTIPMKSLIHRAMGVSGPRLEQEASWPSCLQRTWHVYQLTLSGRLMANGRQLELAHRLQLGESQAPSDDHQYVHSGCGRKSSSSKI